MSDPTFLSNPTSYPGPYPLNFAGNKYVPNPNDPVIINLGGDPGDPYDHILPLGVGTYLGRLRYR